MDGQGPGTPARVVDHGGDDNSSAPPTSSTHSSSGSHPPRTSSTTTGHAMPGGIDSGTPPSNPPGKQPSTTFNNGQPPSPSPSGPSLTPQQAHEILQAHAQNPDANLSDIDAQALDQARQIRAEAIERNLTRKLQVTGKPLPRPEAQALADAIATRRSPPAQAATPHDRAGLPPVQLPGNTRDTPWGGGRSSGDSDNSNLVLAGGSDGPSNPQQGGAAAAPPPASAGKQLTAAVGQMMNGPTGPTNPDVPKAAAGDGRSVRQPAKPAAGGQPPGGNGTPPPRPLETRHDIPVNTTLERRSPLTSSQEAASGQHTHPPAEVQSPPPGKTPKGKKPRDPGPYADFPFGKHLRKLKGAPPANMIYPHAHHILFKEGLGEAQKQLVREGQELLRRFQIDPIMGPENLVWAPMRAEGQHGPEALRHVVDQLKAVEAEGGGREEIVEKLKDLGKIAAQRK